MQRNAHFHRPIDHVIVGHDVSVRGDDHTAANAMLNLPLALSHAGHTVAELLAGSRTDQVRRTGRKDYLPHLALIFTLALLPAAPCPWEVTAMLTTAGVTREATASVAWSSASRGSMLALLIGRDGVISSGRGIDMVVAEDDCSGGENEGKSQQWRSVSAWLLLLIN